MNALENVTQLLLDWNRGNDEAQERLLAIVYAELHRIAAVHFQAEREGHTLQPTAVVHEVYLRLVDQTRIRWQNRAHFFAIASRLMRRALVDHARHRKAEKRGGGAAHLNVDEVLNLSPATRHDTIAIDDALSALERLDPRQARVVELRFFGGLTVEETAETLSVAPVTVKRDWKTARAFLFHHLTAKASNES